jgi:putative MATE family efflux protein
MRHDGDIMFTHTDLRKLIIPLIIEQMLIVTVGLADSMMVSRVGQAAISGVSLVDSINILLIGLFAALATGGAVISSQFLGQKDNKAAGSAGEQLILAIVILSFFAMVIALFCGKGVISLLFGEVDADVMQNARTYLFYSALSFPFIALYNAGAALFRSMGNSKISMIISLIMNIIHITMNAIFIFGIGLGVEGAALSTLISRTFAAVTLLILLKNKKLPIHIQISRCFHMNLTMVKRILRIGVPNGLENSVFQIGKILVQGITAGLGTTAITANAISGSIANVQILPGAAMGLALITVVGRCVGACDYEGVKSYTFKIMKLTYIILAGWNLILLFMIPLILRIYHLPGETARMATQLMIYHGILASLIWALSFTLPNALRAANDVKFTMWISMLSMWIWRIAASYLLAITFHMGVFGIWVAMTIDWVFRSICFVIRFLKEKYREQSVV